jgi:RNA polymerase subunit RPABC4/transcription elongation factor Spt4
MKKSKKEPKCKVERRVCPYCEGEITVAQFPYCQPCGVTLRYCVKCNIVVAKEATVCPQCGSELEWK